MLLRTFSLLLLLALAACKPPRLAKRLPGTWLVEHYDEYYVAADRSTGHALDGVGTVSFTRRGATDRRLGAGRPRGGLTPYAGYRWQLRDSLLTLTGADGGATEQWLVTKDMQHYLELVSVNPTRDTVRTMYLYK